MAIVLQLFYIFAVENHYYGSNITKLNHMRTADTLAPTKTEYNYRAWHIVPDTVTPNRFKLETASGNIVCTLAFPENNNAAHSPFLNLIASAPELQHIAEMYHDAMVGNPSERSMIFTIVCKVLNRVKQRAKP